MAASSLSARDASRIRWGILCLLASGVFSAVGLALRGPVVLPTENPGLWAEVAQIATHDLAWAILLPSLTLQLFGFIALYAYVKDSAQDRIAFWGMVLSIAGNGLFMPFTGILAFVDPVVARFYQAGSAEILAIATAGVEAPFSGALLAASGIILLAGSVLITILLWRSPKLPAWTAIPYLLHAFGLTLAAPFSYTLERAGGGLLLVAAAGITWSVWKGTSPARQSA